MNARSVGGEAIGGPAVTGERPAPRRTSKGDRRRREIIEVAARLFDSNGYHQTSVDDIAEGSGIRKPSLYHHFRSKEEILYMIHEVYGREVIDRYLNRERENPNMSAAEGLYHVFHDLVAVLDVFPEHVRVFFHYERELVASEFHDKIQAMRDEFEKMVEGLIRRGVEQGEFEVVDVKLAVLAFFGMANWTYRWYHQGGAATSKEVAECFHGIFLKGLLAR